MASSSIRTAGPYVFHNLGPLTTTWTAPPSCATSDQSYVTGIAYPNEEGMFRMAFGHCNVDEWRPECFPSGERLLEIHNSVLDEQGPLPTDYNYYMHSPGLHCPDSWETVGVASIGTEKGDVLVHASGIFSSTQFLQPSYFPGDNETILPTPSYNFPANAITSILSPTETVVACCPRYDSQHDIDPHSQHHATQIELRVVLYSDD